MLDEIDQNIKRLSNHSNAGQATQNLDAFSEMVDHYLEAKKHNQHSQHS
jgi:hypothetical protein